MVASNGWSPFSKPLEIEMKKSLPSHQTTMAIGSFDLSRPTPKHEKLRRRKNVQHIQLMIQISPQVFNIEMQLRKPWKRERSQLNVQTDMALTSQTCQIDHSPPNTILPWTEMSPVASFCLSSKRLPKTRVQEGEVEEVERPVQVHISD